MISSNKFITYNHPTNIFKKLTTPPIQPRAMSIRPYIMLILGEPILHIDAIKCGILAD